MVAKARPLDLTEPLRFFAGVRVYFGEARPRQHSGILHHAAIMVSLLLALDAMSQACFAESAAQAARVIAAQKGQAYLTQLVEVRGERGEPDPAAWVFLFNDPSARSGVREFVVQNGQIIAERMPVHVFRGEGQLPSLPASLSLDNHRIFRIAHQEAALHGVGFNWIDYILRTDALTGEPVWFVSLIDYQEASAGTLEIRADTLELRQRLLLPQPPHSGQHPTGADELPLTEWERRLQDMFYRAGKSTERGLRRIAGALEELLTGDRTIDVEEPAPIE